MDISHAHYVQGVTNSNHDHSIFCVLRQVSTLTGWRRHQTRSRPKRSSTWRTTFRSAATSTAGLPQRVSLTMPELQVDSSEALLFWSNGKSFYSVQDGIYALEKVHMRSTPTLRSIPNVAFETVPMFAWLTTALSRPFKEDCLALPLSTPLSSKRSMVWRPWLCTRR